MLPRILCEDLCSLKPGAERLTMSIVWQMNDDGEILDQWFGRSIITSASQLSYKHVQVSDSSI
jgi:DIS3-like exonuclease 2